MLNSRFSKDRVSSDLPITVQELTVKIPELTYLLAIFALRDYGTFMHSLAVHHSANKLIRDLTLLTSNRQLLLIKETLGPFWLLHDIGKLVADPDMNTAQQIVHPKNKFERSILHKANHWIHPIMSFHLLRWLAKTDPYNNISQQLNKWALLALAHDRRLNPFIPINIETLMFEEQLALFIFSICDTAMAMALPRPNDPAIDSFDTVIKVLIKRYLKKLTLLRFFPSQDPNFLRNYIIASLQSSLRELKNQYSETDWTQPRQIASLPSNPKQASKFSETVELLRQNHRPYWESVFNKFVKQRVL